MKPSKQRRARSTSRPTKIITHLVGWWAAVGEPKEEGPDTSLTHERSIAAPKTAWVRIRERLPSTLADPRSAADERGGHGGP